MTRGSVNPTWLRAFTVALSSLDTAGWVYADEGRVRFAAEYPWQHRPWDVSKRAYVYARDGVPLPLMLAGCERRSLDEVTGPPEEAAGVSKSSEPEHISTILLRLLAPIEADLRARGVIGPDAPTVTNGVTNGVTKPVTRERAVRA